MYTSGNGVHVNRPHDCSALQSRIQNKDFSPDFIYDWCLLTRWTFTKTLSFVFVSHRVMFSITRLVIRRVEYIKPNKSNPRQVNPGGSSLTYFPVWLTWLTWLTWFTRSRAERCSATTKASNRENWYLLKISQTF